ncbi:MAG TPA: nitroreductase family protein [Candidatus Binataceae bacterium]|nr:nitroreductase family protein [Candidatus Binataceae bacterium]
MNEIGVFEAIHSARALRRFKPDAIPDEVIAKVLDAAIRAPSAGNGQNWLFVVVKDPLQRQKLGEIYRKAGAMVASFYQRLGRPPHMTEEQYEKFATSGLYLHEHLADAPVLLIPCLRFDSSDSFTSLPADAQIAMMNSFQWMAGASIYPAVQNVILACRALGLGTCLTTNHMLFEDETKKVLGLPAEYRTFALMPIGYPVNKFGGVNRRPLNEVVAVDRFGCQPSW